ncbi:DUF4252 domain-containing protein [Lutibacter sp. B1]|uniref:DUF4252 domain-containing protein n=1 Tax=Lutibacter sp. B1 TaxID=2725996 RepID=UPI0014566810|nr:DUF4252 domain-containing protein [Lutibacter sp. B1]NLP57635.1 DUF4252 domain-containing protein [Lutibacter sp. B1]
MRKYIIILGIGILLTSCATHSNFYSFYKENKKEADFSFGASAFIANAFIPKEDLGAYKKLLRKFRYYRLMVFAENDKIDAEFDDFVKENKYSSLITVSENGDKVNLYLLKEGDLIKEILMKVKSEGDYVLIDGKTKLLESELYEILENSEIEVVGI